MATQIRHDLVTKKNIVTKIFIHNEHTARIQLNHNTSNYNNHADAMSTGKRRHNLYFNWMCHVNTNDSSRCIYYYRHWIWIWTLELYCV